MWDILTHFTAFIFSQCLSTNTSVSQCVYFTVIKLSMLSELAIRMLLIRKLLQWYWLLVSSEVVSKIHQNGSSSNWQTMTPFPVMKTIWKFQQWLEFCRETYHIIWQWFKIIILCCHRPRVNVNKHNITNVCLTDSLQTTILELFYLKYEAESVSSLFPENSHISQQISTKYGIRMVMGVALYL